MIVLRRSSRRLMASLGIRRGLIGVFDLWVFGEREGRRGEGKM